MIVGQLLSRRRIQILIATALTVGLLGEVGDAVAASPEKIDIKMTLAWTFQASQAMFTYGVDKGFFKAEGLNVTVDRGAGSGVSIQRVAGGTYDFGYSDIGNVIRYNAENRTRPLLAIYIVEDDSALALFSLASSGIVKAKDVEGKRIGVSQFDGARLMFPVLAKANNIDVSSITWKTVDAQLREILLARGQVDAITGFTTTSIPLLTSLHRKFNTIRYRDFGVGGFGNALIVSPDFGKKYPDTVRAFVRALNQSVKAMIQNPAEALASLKKRDPLVDMDAERLRLDLMLKDLILTPDVEQHGLSNADPVRLGTAIKDVLQTTSSKDPLAPEEVYSERFLPPASERMPPVYQVKSD
jgi:NitT/TauT family transport system substrate-binding protein